MLEFLGSGLLGSLFGGVFRLAPEVLKYFDKKNERKHESEMFGKQVDLEKTRGQIKLDEIHASHDMAIDSGVMSAFNASIQQQADGGWVAALSASVRPVITYYLLLMYGVVKTSAIINGYDEGLGFAQAVAAIWGPDDIAMLAGVVNYWFLDRTLTKRGL